MSSAGPRLPETADEAAEMLRPYIGDAADAFAAARGGGNALRWFADGSPNRESVLGDSYAGPLQVAVGLMPENNADFVKWYEDHWELSSRADLLPQSWDVSPEEWRLLNV